MDWHSVHVHYHSDDKDPLILHGVRALFGGLPPGVRGAFFLRHWRRGPHLRLNLRCDDDTLNDTVRPIVDDTVGRFLRERPSTQVVDPERLLPMHRRLAELESETGPLLPWRPDNSIHYTVFDRPKSLPDGTGGNLLIDFYVDTNELVFQMMEDIPGGRRRYGAAFDLMIATACALSDIGVIRASLSFRSHAEAFLNGYPEGRGLIDRWEEHYARNATALTDRVRAVVAALDGGEAPVHHVTAWVGALRPYQARVKEFAAEGRLSLAPRPEDAGSGAGSGARSATDSAMDSATDSATADLGAASPFHRELFARPGWARMRESDWFLVYRTMLNFTYLHLTRLGITPAERFLLCHLAANAVEECYDVSALDLVRGRQPGEVTVAGGRSS